MIIDISPKQVQVLSPQMIQSMEILQMGIPELLEYIATAMQENPVLDITESYGNSDDSFDMFHKLDWLETFDSQNYYYQLQDYEAIADSVHSSYATEESRETLYDHVLSQLNALTLDPQLALCAEFLAKCLDRNGWIDEDISVLAGELGQSLELMERALAVVQSLEPPGIGARNLSECLCLQLRHSTPINQLALNIVVGYLEPLAKGSVELVYKSL